MVLEREVLRVGLGLGIANYPLLIALPTTLVDTGFKIKVALELLFEPTLVIEYVAVYGFQ